MISPTTFPLVPRTLVSEAGNVDKVNIYALKKEKKFVKVGLLQWGQ